MTNYYTKAFALWFVQTMFAIGVFSSANFIVEKAYADKSELVGVIDSEAFQAIQKTTKGKK